jgi:hypothetical protein
MAGAVEALNKRVIFYVVRVDHNCGGADGLAEVDLHEVRDADWTIQLVKLTSLQAARARDVVARARIGLRSRRDFLKSASE